MDIKGKVAIVTGGAGNIGKELVAAFIENYCKGVTILDKNEELCKSVYNELTKKYGEDKILLAQCNITNNKEFEDVCEETIKRFGRIDIIVNNAGHGDETNYADTIDVNLTSTTRGTYLGYKYFSKKNGGNGGVVLNIASMAGLISYEYMPIYSATKLAIVGLTACFGKPYHYKESGVAVISLCPGYTSHPKHGILGKSMDEERQKVVRENVAQITSQPCSSVANAAIHVIKEAIPGSNWIIEERKLYKANIPHPDTYHKLVLEDL